MVTFMLLLYKHSRILIFYAPERALQLRSDSGLRSGQNPERLRPLRLRPNFGAKIPLRSASAPGPESER